MLTRPFIRGTLRAGQRGVVLVIALIVLVAMTLAAIALMRSVDTTNIIAGNLAFQQAATHSGDAAVERAIAWLEDCNAGANGCAIGTLDGDDSYHGYSAAGNSAAHNPSGGQTWDAFWMASLNSKSAPIGTDAAHNSPSYVIDRLCTKVGSPTGGASCSSSTVIGTMDGNAEEANELQLKAASLVFYRITVRVTGPRNTVSYIQTMVAL